MLVGHHYDLDARSKGFGIGGLLFFGLGAVLAMVTLLEYFGITLELVKQSLYQSSKKLGETIKESTIWQGAEKRICSIPDHARQSSIVQDSKLLFAVIKQVVKADLRRFFVVWIVVNTVLGARMLFQHRFESATGQEGLSYAVATVTSPTTPSSIFAGCTYTINRPNAKPDPTPSIWSTFASVNTPAQTAEPSSFQVSSSDSTKSEAPIGAATAIPGDANNIRAHVFRQDGYWHIALVRGRDDARQDELPKDSIRLQRSTHADLKVVEVADSDIKPVTEVETFLESTQEEQLEPDQEISKSAEVPLRITLSEQIHDAIFEARQQMWMSRHPEAWLTSRYQQLLHLRDDLEDVVERHDLQSSLADFEDGDEEFQEELHEVKRALDEIMSRTPAEWEAELRRTLSELQEDPSFALSKPRDQAQGPATPSTTPAPTERVITYAQASQATAKSMETVERGPVTRQALRRGHPGCLADDPRDRKSDEQRRQVVRMAQEAGRGWDVTICD